MSYEKIPLRGIDCTSCEEKNSLEFYDYGYSEICGADMRFFNNVIFSGQYRFEEDEEVSNEK